MHPPLLKLSATPTGKHMFEIRPPSLIATEGVSASPGPGADRAPAGALSNAVQSPSSALTSIRSPLPHGSIPAGALTAFFVLPSCSPRPFDGALEVEGAASPGEDSADVDAVGENRESVDGGGGADVGRLEEAPVMLL